MGGNSQVAVIEEAGEKEILPWPVRLFQKSPLKQEKWKQILKLLPSLDNMECLDIGSDNGVMSYYLRQLGGRWSSCDLESETVESIRSLVHERVDQIDSKQTPYSDHTFDLIVIVDFLEHIESDKEFVCELYRILKPNGTLLVNVPNPKEGILRLVRNLIGQGDDVHGHVRPGYSLEDLQTLLGASFRYEASHTYSRIFSVLVDTCITFALDRLKKGGHGQKGRVVTGSDMKSFEKSFKLYSLMYPFISLFVKLDSMFPSLRGNMLIARFEKCGVESTRKPNKGEEISGVIE